MNEEIVATQTKIRTSRHLTDIDKQCIIEQLAIGESVNLVAKNMKIAWSAVDRVRKETLAEVANRKKEIIESSRKTHTDMMKDIQQRRIEIIRDCGELMTKDKLKECSGPQLAMVMGINTDKYNLTAGLPTSNENIKFTNRDDMINFIKGMKINAVEPAKTDVNKSAHQVINELKTKQPEDIDGKVEHVNNG